MKNTARIILALLALIIIVGIAYGISKSFSGVKTETAEHVVKPANCGGCYDLSDNGRTIAITPTSRITILLPTAGYDKNALSIMPAGTLGETFGANAEPGGWVRTFEAAHSGIAMITVPALNSTYSDYRLMVSVADSSSTATVPPHVNSPSTTVTQSDNGRTVYVRKGDRFVLELGDMLWTLSFNPQNIVNRVVNIAMIRGAQGIYTADKVGTTTLTAVGKPNCAAGQMCAQYLVNFKTTIVVKP